VSDARHNETRWRPRWMITTNPTTRSMTRSTVASTRAMFAETANGAAANGARDDADGAPVDVVVDRLLTALEERVEADAVQNKLHNEPREGDITVTDPRGELGPRPERPGP